MSTRLLLTHTAWAAICRGAPLGTAHLRAVAVSKWQKWPHGFRVFVIGAMLGHPEVQRFARSVDATTFHIVVGCPLWLAVCSCLSARSCLSMSSMPPGCLCGEEWEQQAGLRASLACRNGLWARAAPAHSGWAMPAGRRLRRRRQIRTGGDRCQGGGREDTPDGAGSGAGFARGAKR